MKHYLLLILCLLVGFGVFAQEPALQGMQYQAIARDAEGVPLANTAISVRVSFTDAETEKERYYTEAHTVMTNFEGYFQLIIGQGNWKNGSLDEVPWTKQPVWLTMEWRSQDQQAFTLASKTELQVVPYALNAGSANQLSGEETKLRSQSIYWTTSGNNKTRPNVHFLGTRDEQNLVFKTNNVPRMTLTKDGQLQMFAGDIVCGPDNDKKSYPYVIQGSNQGIWIRIKEARDSDNNFMTFVDTEDDQGAVEGQTVGELLVSYEYLSTNAAYAIELLSEGLDLAGNISESAGWFAGAGIAAASLFLAFAAPGLAIVGAAAGLSSGNNAAKLAVKAFEIKEYNVDAISNAGVVYESGSADYAEWLERAEGVRDLHLAEVVGVKGGKISLNTSNADHLMVISTHPIFLGNMPPQDRLDQFEKVAFLGQVPVKVWGKVTAGDYILPSGKNDGLAVAVSPQQITVEQYKQIIGVAWANSESDEGLHYINVGVGLHKNALAGEVEKLEHKIENIENYLKNGGDLRRPFDPDAPSERHRLAPIATELDHTTFDKFVDENEQILKEAFQNVADQFDDQGYNVSDFPIWAEIIEDPARMIKQMHRDPSLVHLWGRIDLKIKRKQSN